MTTNILILFEISLRTWTSPWTCVRDALSSREHTLQLCLCRRATNFLQFHKILQIPAIPRVSAKFPQKFVVASIFTYVTRSVERI